MGYTFKKKSESPFGTIEAGTKLERTSKQYYHAKSKGSDGSEWKEPFYAEFIQDPRNSEWFEYDGNPDVLIAIKETRDFEFQIDISGFEGTEAELNTLIRNAIQTFIHEKKASQPAES